MLNPGRKVLKKVMILKWWIILYSDLEMERNKMLLRNLMGGLKKWSGDRLLHYWKRNWRDIFKTVTLISVLCFVVKAELKSLGMGRELHKWKSWNLHSLINFWIVASNIIVSSNKNLIWKHYYTLNTNPRDLWYI